MVVDLGIEWAWKGMVGFGEVRGRIGQKPVERKMDMQMRVYGKPSVVEELIGKRYFLHANLGRKRCHWSWW